MTFKRCTLHVTHLDSFMFWLRDIKQTPYRDGKGPWQVIQVLTDSGWQVVFRKANMPEHFSVNEKLMPLVMEFYKFRVEVGV